MQVTSRFEKAVLKLYTAFHDGSLNPECCKQCAVGNILDKRDFWKHLSDHHGSSKLNYIGAVNEALNKKFNGYSPSELLKIEIAFLEGCGFSLPLNRTSKRPKDPTSKSVLFNGLSSAIDILCKLDGIENIMNCTELFKFESVKDEHKKFVY